MGGDELSSSGVLCMFGERAVEDDREANGRFIPPSSRGRAGVMGALMEAAREQSGGKDLGKMEERFEKVMSRPDDADWQLPTLLMSVAAWSLREQGLAELECLDGDEPKCRMTLTGWTPRPSVEGRLLDTLKSGGPKGLRRRWKLGKALGRESSLRSTIALMEVGRPDNPWDMFRALWEAEATDAGHVTKKELTPLYEETMERWRHFNQEEEGALADAIREDAFFGISAHLPATWQGTNF